MVGSNVVDGQWRTSGSAWSVRDSFASIFGVGGGGDTGAAGVGVGVGGKQVGGGATTEAVQMTPRQSLAAAAAAAEGDSN